MIGRIRKNLNLEALVSNRLLAFEALFKALLIIQWMSVMLWWRFFYAASDQIIKSPVLESLNFLLNEYVHYGICAIYTLSVVLLFKKNFTLPFVGILVSLLYFILEDYFQYHHDIYLTINILVLFILFRMKVFSEERFWRLLLLLSFVVYVLSGIGKINPSFIAGEVIGSMFLERFGVSGSQFDLMFQALAIFTILFEILFPFLLWKIVKKNWLIMAGFIFHFSLGMIFGRGKIFNLMLPLTWLAFIPIIVNKTKFWVFPRRVHPYLVLVSFYALLLFLYQGGLIFLSQIKKLF